jgi:hypothetical protein
MRSASGHACRKPWQRFAKWTTDRRRVEVE